MSLYFDTLAGFAGTRGYTEGVKSVARFNFPNGICVDSQFNLYVADTENHVIRKITSAGVTSIIAGSPQNPGSNDTVGAGLLNRFYSPHDVCVDADGNLFVADTYNSTIRKVTSSGVVSTLAGLASVTGGSADGTGTTARFYRPVGVCVDGSGNIFVSDSGNRTIRKVTSAGVVTTLAGAAGAEGNVNGTGSVARFGYPYKICIDESGNLFVSDYGNNSIRKVTSAGVVTTIALQSGASLTRPAGIAFHASTGDFYVTNSYLGNSISRVTSAGAVSVVAGITGTPGSNNGLGSNARFNHPTAVAIDSQNVLYVADQFNHTIRNSVASIAATITLSNLTHTYNGAAKIPTTTVSPSGLTVQLAYTGTAASLSAPVSAGSYVVTASVVDNFYYGTTSGVVTISKASQTITFASMPTRFAGSGAFQVFPTASSNLTVALSSSNTAVATVTGSSITPLTAGSTTISATQAGDLNFNAAVTVDRVLTVVNTPIAQTISFDKLPPAASSATTP